MILLHRFNKSKSNNFPWLVNEEYIASVNSTRYGTLVVLDGTTDDAYVVESIEEIAEMLGILEGRNNDPERSH